MNTNRRCLFGIFSVLILSLGMAESARADDWPMFRGDAARSASSPSALDLPLTRAWTYRTGHRPQPAWPRLKRMIFDRVFHPVSSQGRVYFGSSADGLLRAIDLQTGEKLWSFASEGPIRFAPALWRDRVFFVSDDGHLYCLQADDGSLVFKRRGGPDHRSVLGNGRLISRWCARGGPVIKGDVVYFAAGIWPTDGITVEALDAETGRVLWTNNESGDIFMPQPHGGADAESGISAQGHLVATEEFLLVPNGRAVPSAFDRHTGEFRYFHLQKNGHRGGTATMASGKHFFNSGHFFDAKTGVSRGSTGGGAIAGLPDGLVVANDRGVDIFRWQTKPSKEGGATTRSLVKTQSFGAVQGNLSVIVCGSKVILGGHRTASILDLRTGERLWSTTVDGDVWGLAVADGRLLVSTDAGSLIGFRSPGAVAHQPLVFDESPSQEPTDEGPALEEVASSILERSGLREGYAVDLDCGDGSLLEAVLLQSELFAIGIARDEEEASRARARLQAKGLYGVRSQIVLRENDDTGLPNYLADLVICQKSLNHEPPSSTRREASRIQRPLGGTVCLGPPDEPHTFTVRGALPGAGDWTHQYADPGNTVCSDDLVRGRLGVLWFGDINQSLTQRHGRGPSPLYLDGRIYSLGLDALVAVDAYNGRYLWQVPFPGILKAYDGDHLMGTAGTQSLYCVSEEGVFVRTGSTCHWIDRIHGHKKGEFQIPENMGIEPGPWGYIAVDQGRLFGSRANPEHVVTYRYLDSGDLSTQLTESSHLFAIDITSGETLWTYEANHSLRHNAIAIGGGQVYLIDRPLALFDRNRGEKGDQPLGKLVALDASKGDVLWSSEEDVFGTTLSLSASRGRLVMGYQPTRFRLDSEVGGRLAVFETEKGQRLWEHETPYHSRLVINDQTVYAQGGAWDLENGVDRPFDFERSYGCGILASGRHMMVYRSATLGYFDLGLNEGTENFGGLRPGCWVNALPAGGLVLVPDGSSGCVCSYQNKAWVALVPDPVRSPTAVPRSGAYSKPVAVSLTAESSDAELHYTLDGTLPTKASPRYVAPIEIDGSSVLKAIAVRPGEPSSRESTFRYTIDPHLLPLDLASWTQWDEREGVTSAPGKWSLQEGILRQTSNIHTTAAAKLNDPTLPRYGTLWTYAGQQELSDGTFELDLRSLDDDELGVVFRYRDPNHHYLFAMNAQRGFRVLACRNGEAYRILAHDNVSYESHRWYRVRIELDGPSLAVFVDDQPVFREVDPTHIGGTLGLHSWGNSGSEFRHIRFRSD